MRRLVQMLLVTLLVTACTQTASPPTPRPDAPDARFGSMPAPQFGDSRPHDWSGRGPAAYAIHGIDVARYQGQINWNRAQSAGVSFAYIKATEGGDILDPMFRDHWRGARRAGVRYGAYHYYYFCRPAEDQARWFIRNVPLDPRALPPVLDMEWNPTSPTCTLRPDGRTVRAEAKRFLDILERHYGRRPVVYTTLDFYRDTDIGKLAGTEFWLRSVAGHPRDTYPRQRWTFWQYSGTGLVSGINGNVDLNVFAGSPEAWRSWAD